MVSFVRKSDLMVTRHLLMNVVRRKMKHVIVIEIVTYALKNE